MTHGDHTIKAIATDTAGNTTATPIVKTYTVDAIYPEATVNGFPATTEHFLRTTAVDFTVTSNDSNDPLTIEVLRSDGNWVPCTSGACRYTTADGADNMDTQETVTIRYADVAGNSVNQTAGTVYVDRTAPTITLSLNKTSFNAADTIQATVTTTEELTGEPIVEIPSVPMTLGDPTQISTFSWLYTLDPHLLADNNYTMNAAGTDLVAYDDQDTKTFSVDTSIPDLEEGAYGIDRAKAGIGITYTVDFETTEPVEGTDGVPTVTANEIILSCAKNGSDTVFRCTRTVGAEETDATVYGIRTTLTDAAGNSRTVTIGSVMADKTLPDAVAGTVVLSIDAGLDCALTQEQVTTLADGSTAHLSVQVSEKLANDYEPVLTAKRTDAPDRAFHLDAQNGLTYYFSHLYDEDDPEPVMIGEYTLELTLKDEAGNENTIENLVSDKAFVTAENTDPELNINQDLVSYNRSPWGRAIEMELKDEADNVVYAIPANDYFELGPKDIYAAVNRLPAETFVLNYGPHTETPVMLNVWAKDGTQLRMAHPSPNPDGTWPRSRVWSLDRPVISVSALDSACRETPRVKIRDNNWIATMNKKVPGSTFENPHIFTTIGSFKETLEQYENEKTEPPLTDNKGLTTFNSYLSKKGTYNNRWTQLSSSASGGSPLKRQNAMMVYDSARAKIVLFGGVQTSNFTPLNDTWEWDGASWKELRPSISPSAREAGAFVYDKARGKVLLFGGGGWYGVGDFDDTWEWDGTNWVKRAPVVSPAARSGHGMVFDSVRGKTILFGGFTGNYPDFSYYDDTWEWDGTNWTEKWPNNSPAGCFAGNAMAYDRSHHRIVLFGCGKIDGNNNDTWEWDGENWEKKSPVEPPHLRHGHAIEYDIVHERTVLFGGWGVVGGVMSQLNDSWEWDGNNWTQTSPTRNPSARSFHAMAYDNIRERMVLFGGQGADTAFNDIWEWDGIDWTQKDGTGQTSWPSTRRRTALAYDADRGKTVLFGGYDSGKTCSSQGDSTYCGDMWEWDGRDWTKRFSSGGSYGHVMAYDTVKRKVFGFGGGIYGDSNTSWEWDGTSWSNLDPAHKPPTREDFAMAYDSIRGKMVLFGGYDSSKECTAGLSTHCNDTWEWDGISWAQSDPPTKPPAR
ncbi:MAG TPA: hypothetical protein PKH10_08990, partial [bacterium]|nr:hypothetical protein [bacterium]